jgi:hypothetical protein
VDPLLILAIIIMIAAVTGITKSARRAARQRRHNGDGLTFEVLSRPDRITESDQVPRQDSEFHVKARRINPDGRCLRTGKRIRECTCSTHR